MIYIDAGAFASSAFDVRSALSRSQVARRRAAAHLKQESWAYLDRMIWKRPVEILEHALMRALKLLRQFRSDM